MDKNICSREVAPMIEKVPCTRCGGTGRVYNELVERPLRCSPCGGQGWTPKGEGILFFYCPINWRYGCYTERVAIMSGRNGRYRVTVFDRFGPVYHVIRKAKTANEDLKRYVLHPLAERTLDAWGRTVAWRHYRQMARRSA